ncbi:MAG: hypothetical protein KDD69_12275 [Bdellovibrionales bacterium]|nr:hypothetical protein [Bdellovibrionales bacterium]
MSERKKVFLSEADKNLPIKELMARFQVSKATAYWGRKRGWIFVGYHRVLPQERIALESLPPAKELRPGEEIVLSELERKLTRNQLAQRYAIGKKQAKEALEAGVVRRASRLRVARAVTSAERWTPAKPRDYDPESRLFRVNLAPGEYTYTVQRLMELYSAFGLSERQAYEARRSGYFCPNADRPREIEVDEAVFSLFAEDCLKSAEEGARSALRSMLGANWRRVLRGVSMQDVSGAALDRLRELSGREEFGSERWRFVVARFAAKRFIGERLREMKFEATTVDELEGRFDDEI